MLKLKTNVLIILLISPFVESLRFELRSGTQKCITEEIRLSTMNVGKYSVVNPNSGYPLPDVYKISLHVTSPQGTTYHQVNEVESGGFVFTAAQEGDFKACFFAANHKPPLTMNIEFEWKSGLNAKDWTNVAKKSQLEVMSYELLRLLDVATTIHDDMFYLRQREEEMQNLNRSTNSKMATFSLISLVICLSVAGIQLWHLKNFFESKKII